MQPDTYEPEDGSGFPLQDGDMALIRDEWPPDEMTEEHLAALERRAEEPRGEWDWYRDHVPVLVAEIRRLRGDR